MAASYSALLWMEAANRLLLADEEKAAKAKAQGADAPAAPEPDEKAE